VYVDCLAVEACEVVARTEKPEGRALNDPELSPDRIRATNGALLTVCIAGVLNVVLKVLSVNPDTVGIGFTL
jgi:hypothetical protein